MNCIINGIDFYTLEAMKYYAPSTSWSAEKKKENAMNKIFSGDWVGARKMDGIYCMCGKNPDGEIFWRPRAKNTKGEFVNKVDWLPQIHDFLNELDPGTVFLGETYLPNHEEAKATTSVMNCLLPKSLKRQENEDYRLHLYIFDVLAENNKSYLDMEAENRFDLLNTFARAYPHDYVGWAQYKEGQELWDELQKILAEGGEGIVITYKKAPYQPGKRSSKVSLKVKKEMQETIDCVVMGAVAPTKIYTGKEIEAWPYWFNETTNERIMAGDYLAEHHESIYATYVDGGTVIPVTKNWYYGWAGSWQIGAYKDGKLIPIGKLSGLTDEMKENWKDYVGSVAEISCMEIMDNQDGGQGLRHPKLISIRDDVDAQDCTWERIFK